MVGTAAAIQDEPSVTVFQSDLPVDAKIGRARTELLDLSARNRLLNILRSAKSVKSLEIVDEKASEVFRMLLREGKAFTFLPGRVGRKSAAEGAGSEGGVEEGGEPEVADALPQPEDDTLNERGVFTR